MLLTLARNMNRVAIHCKRGDWNHAMLAVWVEKPPVPMVDRPWHNASNSPMPPKK